VSDRLKIIAPPLLTVAVSFGVPVTVRSLEQLGPAVEVSAAVEDEPDPPDDAT
jgi:hypothetical protein